MFVSLFEAMFGSTVAGFHIIFTLALGIISLKIK